MSVVSVVVVVVREAKAGRASGGRGVSVANVDDVVALPVVASAEQPTKSTDAHTSARTSPFMG